MKGGTDPEVSLGITLQQRIGFLVRRAAAYDALLTLELPEGLHSPGRREALAVQLASEDLLAVLGRRGWFAMRLESDTLAALIHAGRTTTAAPPPR